MTATKPKEPPVVVTPAEMASWLQHEREAACECGARFGQQQLTERFMLMVEKRGPKVVEMLMKQIPGLWVPVHCPTCERKDITRQARLDEMRARPDMRSSYGDRDGDT